MQILGYGIIKIIGQSMEPALKAGSFAMCKSVKSAGDIKVGDIIVFDSPDIAKYGAAQHVKRVVRIEPDGLWVEGDNKNRSIDSRHYGLVIAKNYRLIF
jgi:signal peptidase I